MSQIHRILTPVFVVILATLGACATGNNNQGGNGGGGGGGNQPLVLNFAAPDTYPAGQLPATAQSIVLGDFDGDGDLDIAVPNNGDNNVGVFLNNGDGTFQPQATYPTQSGPQVIQAGLFNNDNFLDLLAGTATNFASYLPNSGANGVFDTKTDVDFGDALVGIGTGDFDKDNDLDGAFSSGGGNLKLLQNDGAPNFNPVNFPSNAKITSPRSLAAEDFNGDGEVDVAIVDFAGDRVAVWINSGNAAMLFPDTNIDNSLALPPGASAQGIAAGDFNGDGQIDIVVPNANTDNVSVFMNQGGGTFAAGNVITAGDDSFGVTVGDFNNDGNLDFAIANFLGNSGAVNSDVAVILGNGDGTFQDAQYFTVGVANGARGVAAGDLNGDGLIDLVTSNSPANNISVLLNSSAP